MIAALIRFVLGQRLLVLLAALALSVAGVWAFRTLPIDAFPDISSPQVQVIVKAPGMAPHEVESRITFPLEMELQGLPQQTVLRSTTKYALAVVVLDFENGTDIYWARQQVAERLAQVRNELPPEVEAVLAPITTPLGEIYMYRLVGDGKSLAELRTIQDWIVRPRLRTVDGVADINSLGGEVRAYEVVPNPARLAAQGLGLDEVETALERNNRNAGGDRINRENSILLVRTEGRLRTREDIENVVVVTRAGMPVRVKDIGDVRLGSLTRYGAVTGHAQGEQATGLVLLRKGANGRATVDGVKQAIAELKPALPPGVEIEPFYDRSELIEAAVWTVEKVLGEAVVLVLVVLVVLLGNLRAALTVALILPLSVLFTFLAMRIFGISANLMSLGGLAIAVGLLVDAAVVVVENVQARLAHADGEEPLQAVFQATREVAAPVISGILIIALVFLPLFSLTGLEGKMFTPLAVTIVFALLGSLLLSLTAIPVLASFLMRSAPAKKDSNGGAHEGWVVARLKRIYAPIVDWSLRHRAVPVGVAIVLLVAALALFPFIGREFMPAMDEGTTVIIVEKAPDISLEHSLERDRPIQQAMMELPEVVGVMSRTGADELRMDPMGLYQTDNFLITRPRSEWNRSLAEFHAALREKLERFPGIETAFTQPIDMRVSEMLTGVRAAMAIKLFGDDLALLEQKGKEIEAIVTRTPGATDIFRAPLSGQKYLEIAIRPQAIARYGIVTEDVNRTIETAVAGRAVTEIVEENRRVPVLVRFPLDGRNSPAALRRILVESPGGAGVPLGLLADIRETDGPVQISRESGKRVTVVQADVQGRDVVGFVDEIRAAIAREVQLPAGYFVTFGGQFENQQRAAARLGLVVPVAVALIFVMLFITFGSLRQAGLVLLNIPFALIGGVIGLYVSGLYVSVPASVGFITLFGIAVLNGVVMVGYFNQLRAAGRSVIEAVREGAARRLRPVLMTAMIAALGLVPMLAATGPGSELQRPLAVVVVAGLITSTLLTLVLLPTLYAWLEARHEGRRRG